MKLIQVIAGVIFVVLLAGYCAQQSGRSGTAKIDSEARRELTARNLTVETISVVDGVREQAVCGRASGQRFVYRDRSKHGGQMSGLVLERDFSTEVFEPFVQGWCTPAAN